jgi:hypothetical protein
VELADRAKEDAAKCLKWAAGARSGAKTKDWLDPEGARHFASYAESYERVAAEESEMAETYRREAEDHARKKQKYLSRWW